MQLLQAAPLACVSLFCLLAIYYDLRERRIPNSLNLLALLFAALFAALSGKLEVAFGSFVIVSFAFAFILYKLGVWAGGDAKFFTTLLAFFPLFRNAAVEYVVFVFLAAAALTLPVLAFLHWKKMFSLWREFASAASSSLAPALGGAIVSAILLLSLAALLNSPPEKGLDKFAASFAILFAIAFLSKCFTLVSQKILRETISISSLKEGDIPAQSVYLEGGKPHPWEPPSAKQLLGSALRIGPAALQGAFPPKGEIISCLRARGVSKQEISKLKEAGVKQLAVKQSIPFAPALALGFVLVAWLV